MRGANAFRIGVPENCDHLRANHFSRTVAPLAFWIRAINFDELREVYAILKGVCDSLGHYRDPR